MHEVGRFKRASDSRNRKSKTSPSVRRFDKFIIALGFINIVATIPQVMQIWVNHNASGISLISWGYYSFFAFMLLVYGIIHKQMPIIINYLGGAILYTFVLIGSIIYR